MSNNYDITEREEFVKFKATPIATTALDADMGTGRWAETDASGYAIKAASGAVQTDPATLPRGSARPIVEGLINAAGSKNPDVEESNHVALGYGQHVAETDEYIATPGGSRPAYARNVPLVVLDGTLTTYSLADGDLPFAVVGYVIEPPASSGAVMKIHVW